MSLVKTIIGGTRTATCGEVPEHGQYTSRKYLSTWTKCPKCSKIIEDERAEKEKLELAHENRRKWKEQLGHADIPERFMDRTLDNYRVNCDGQRKALEFAKNYASNFKKGAPSAMFLGDVGTGKNHLAAGIAIELMQAGHTVLFTKVSRAMRRIKSTWGKHSTESEAQAIAAFTRPGLLILDEWGVQFGSDTERNLMFDILDERHERCWPTLYLGNLTLDEMRGYLGERAYDRIKEDGGEYVPFTWESYRGK